MNPLRRALPYAFAFWVVVGLVLGGLGVARSTMIEHRRKFRRK